MSSLLWDPSDPLPQTRKDLVIYVGLNPVQEGLYFGFGIRYCPGFGRVRSLVFPDLGPGSAHFKLNSFEARIFGLVRVGSKFSFDGQTWVRESLKFDLSSLKWFEVHYFWVMPVQ